MSDIQLCTWGSVGFGVGGLLSRYWCGPPRGSGGRSPIERMVGWAKRAEDLGFDYLLIGQRWLAGVDGTPEDGTLECFTNTTYMTAQTSRIHLISAIHPGLWLPAVMAKMGASIDQLGGGRWDINITSGWHRQEFEMFGGEWLDHDDRYARSEEFIEVLKLAWTRPSFDYRGRFYDLRDVAVLPKPVQSPHPAIFQGGNSPAARRMAARLSDWYFMNGGPPDRIVPQVREVSDQAAHHGRRVRFCLNAWVICRETDRQAQRELERAVRYADLDQIGRMRDLANNARGMWSRATIADLVQANEGFATGLIGSPETILERMIEWHRLGMDMFILGFMYQPEDLRRFAAEVLPRLKSAVHDHVPDRLPVAGHSGGDPPG